MDVQLAVNSNGRYDISVENSDLKTDEGFSTAIFISLLTDARADIIAAPELRRGWLGNVSSPIVGRDLGSLLWLVEQRRLTQKTLNEVVDYARKALAWFVDDGIATNITVTGKIVPKRGVALEIDIESLSGETDSHYVPLWEATVNNAN